jgi:tRNA(Ile)-lysidine synthase TilS/MesJ
VLEEKVRWMIARHGMVNAGETLLVAVSSGVDSVVLLEVLGRLAPELEIRLVIGHLDRGLRKP